MTPINFPQANTCFRSPADLDESQCGTVPAFVGTYAGGNMDGAGVVIVAWLPSEKERRQIAAGAPVFIGILGNSLPPHFLATEFPQ